VDLALKTTARMQEESLQWWTGMMGGSQFIYGWQTRARSIGMGAAATAQKSGEEYVHAMEQSYRRALELVRHACKNGDVRSVRDMQVRVRAVWEEMFGTIRANTKAFIEANTKAMDSWAELVRSGG
jgi:hypothetical protein